MHSDVDSLGRRFFLNFHRHACNNMLSFYWNKQEHAATTNNTRAPGSFLTSRVITASVRYLSVTVRMHANACGPLHWVTPGCNGKFSTHIPCTLPTPTCSLQGCDRHTHTRALAPCRVCMRPTKSQGGWAGHKPRGEQGGGSRMQDAHTQSPLALGGTDSSGTKTSSSKHTLQSAVTTRQRVRPPQAVTTNMDLREIIPAI